ncbi:MAG TPA: 50S ribosomal protein L10 [Clostridia bacterium]|nr:50S ribosomal protein L10 [Clostridia bacterium]
MPSEKILERKQKVVAELADSLKGSCSGVLVDYKGITVIDDTKLRAELREAGVKYEVVKNTLLSLAAKSAKLEDLEPVLTGTTAMATSKDDYTAAARILSKFAQTHKFFTLKSGFVDGNVIGVDTLARLAKLPSREILLASVCNVFNAPIAAFARSIQAIVDKENESATA